MKDEQRQAAKKRMMALMQEGYSWQEAARLSGIQTSRSTAYRWFQLPGVAVSTLHTVTVELRSFNDRQYNRDLLALCQRVNERQVRLPDGRLLVFSVKETCRPILHGQKRLIA